jgi:hypothetical protein
MKTQELLSGTILLGFGLSLSMISPVLSQSIPNYCDQIEESGGSTFVLAETKDFYINICGGDLPNTYIGINKKNPDNMIVLPLSDYDPTGDYFEAINGNISYLLIRGTTKGDFLTVTQGEKELFRQPILYWD